MKTFGKYLGEAMLYELPLAPDDVLNAIDRVEKLKVDDNTPNHVYSFATLDRYFGNSIGFLFMKGYADHWIGERMDTKKISEIMSSAKEYKKVARMWCKEAEDIIKRYGRKNLDGKYRTHCCLLKVKSIEEVCVEGQRVLDTVKKGMVFWKGLKSVAASKVKRREFKFEDDMVRLYDISGKEINRCKFESLKSNVKKMFEKSVWCENLGLYVLCGPTKESGLPSAHCIMVVEE